MTGPRYGPFDAWNPHQPDAAAAVARWRPGRRTAAVTVVVVAAVVAALLVGVWIGWSTTAGDGTGGGMDPGAGSGPGVGFGVPPSADVDAPDGRRDPDVVAAAFVRRYAMHDPAACELVTSALRAGLEREGRCAGPARGPVPGLAVVSSLTCGQVHDFVAAVAPAGQFGKRFASLGLERSGDGWLVRSVLAIEDCRVLTPPSCATR